MTTKETHEFSKRLIYSEFMLKMLKQAQDIMHASVREGTDPEVIAKMDTEAM